jgi:hypothetical protein
VLDHGDSRGATSRGTRAGAGRHGRTWAGRRPRERERDTDVVWAPGERTARELGGQTPLEMGRGLGRSCARDGELGLSGQRNAGWPMAS